ncbi:MAG: hypothetical protein EXS36_16650 [Pedosphaera sp.]|nr:hypothetical protein [Pedosphaera sp.]
MTKPLVRISLPIWLLLTAAFGGPVASPAPGLPATIPAAASIRATPPGVAAAEAVSQITGIAISPLLGVGAVGAWRYFHVAPAARSSLPWFARPWFWMPALALVALCFAKDLFGPVIPKVLKKPIDVVELFENKLSGLLATGAIIPLLAAVVQTLDAQGTAPAALGLAAISPSAAGGGLLAVFGVIAYGVVWLVAHATQVLILLSPFNTLDLALKGFRTAILGSVVASSFVNPFIGAVWAGLIILTAAFFSGWALRLLVFGHVFAWDSVSLRHTRFAPVGKAHPAFLARKCSGLARRTFGRIFRDDAGGLMFVYRPWLVLPERSVPLPVGRYVVGQGLLYPSLRFAGMLDKGDWAWFPPRFRGHEAELSRALRLEAVRPVGLRAAWGWLKDTLRSSVAPAG